MKKFILSFVYLVNFVYCNDGEPNVKYINDHIPHVFERNLITLEVDSQSIIDEHYRYGTANTSVKNFQGLTMVNFFPDKRPLLPHGIKEE
jgi:hypothetical protein